MKKLAFREKLFFGTGSFAKDLFMGMASAYLMVFYTDVFGITAGMAGLVIMITKLIDAFSNPLIGMAVDRTRTRFGKYRPYFLLVPIPFAVFIALTFYTPDMSVNAKFVYALITYNLAGMAFTAMDVSLWGIVPSLTHDTKERSTLISLARVCTSVATLIVSSVALPLVAILGGEDAGKGYFLLAICIGFLSILFAWLTFFNTKERYTSSSPSPKFKEYYQMILKNKGIVSVISVVICYALSMGLSLSMGVYYVIYYVHRADLVPVYMLATISAKVIGSLIAGQMAVRFGNKSATKYCFIIVVVASICMFFVPPTMFWLFMIFAVIVGLMTGIVVVTMTAMMADLADYVEYQTHKRSDGVLFSLNALAIQIGMAVASGIGGLILQSTGYVPNAAVQTDSTILWINLMRSIAPALIAILPIVLIRYYPINSVAEYEEIGKELEARRGSNKEN